MAVNHTTSVLAASEPVFKPSLAPRCFLNWRSPVAGYPSQLQGSLENYNPAIPSILYMENVMPIAEGLASVNMRTTLADGVTVPVHSEDVNYGPTAGGRYSSHRLTVLRDAAENRYPLITVLNSVGGGVASVYLAGAWVNKAIPGHITPGNVTAVANVNGRSIFCVQNGSFSQLFEYDVGTATMVAIVPLGFPPVAAVRGIGSCGNYFLVFTDTIIYWGSPLNMLDLADINAGAGNQTPIDLKGNIKAILPISGGAIIYTTRGALAMRLTNNAAAPFIYSEISGSGAVLYDEWVTADAGGSSHYTWSLNGLQKISLNSCEPIFAKLSDYLVSGQRTRWNNSTNSLEELPTFDNPTPIKVSLIGARFLVISYHVFVTPLPGGPPPINPEDDGSLFNYAFVYDLVLRRFGHLAVQHSDAVAEFTYVPGTESPTSKASIHFLHRSGRIRVARWGRPDQYSLTITTPVAAQESVLVLGPYEVTAAREFTLQRLSLQAGIRDNPTSHVPAVYVNGAALVPIAGSSIIDASYDARITTKVAQIAIIGGFTLHDVSLEYTIHGHR